MEEYVDVIEILEKILANKQLKSDEVKAINFAINEVSRQIPKHTTKKSGFYEREYGKHCHDHRAAMINAIPLNYNNIYYDCPSCGNEFGWHYTSKYCDQCGQRVYGGD